MYFRFTNIVVIKYGRVVKPDIWDVVYAVSNHSDLPISHTTFPPQRDK